MLGKWRHFVLTTSKGCFRVRLGEVRIGCNGTLSGTSSPYIIKRHHTATGAATVSFLQTDHRVPGRGMKVGTLTMDDTFFLYAS